MATPTSSTRPSDAKDEVKDAASTFMEQVFTVRYSESSKEYWARARPLVTPRLYPALKKDLDIDDGLDKARARFGSDARAKSKVLGDVQVSKISSDAATTRVKFTIQIQKPEDDGWKTVKKSAEETATIKLVKDGDDWLVDDVD